MDWLDIHFHSQVLGMETRMQVLLPERANAADMDEEKTAALPDFGGLYFLHGMGNGYTAMTRWTNIDRYANGHNLAVFMPEGALSWYTDMKYGQRYFTYITEELPGICRHFFPRLSQTRKDTYIAGVSMGGYGALRCAMNRSDLYQGVGLFAPAIENLDILRSEEEKQKPGLFSDIYGSLAECTGSESDLMAQADARKDEPGKARVFQCCGVRDPLYQANLGMRDALIRNGWDVTYSEGDASHDFAYWDTELTPFFEWIDETRENA